MKKNIILSVLCLLFMANVAAMFENFNYIAPEDFKTRLERNEEMIIVDIQGAKEFAAHHFPGSLETNAYPVKSDGEKKRIDRAVALFQQTNNKVVVVCPRGGGGAKRCYSYMKSQGVPAEKLTILKGGAEKWPYKSMMVSSH